VRMADSVATRLRRAGLSGRTVTIKVRFGDFVTRTRSHTAPTTLSDGPTIASLATELLDRVDLSPGIRLLGVGVSNLVTGTDAPAATEQMQLDLGERDAGQGADGPASAGPVPRWRDAAGAVEAIRQRFGDTAVGPATLIGPSGLRVKRPGDTQWGPSAAAHPYPESKA
jgi:DNA polymerase-4